MQRIVVDGMNVIGSRPDGWWRDRDGAALRLLTRLQSYASEHGVEVTLVLDGPAFAALPEGTHEGVTVRFAREAGFDTADDLIVALLQADPEPRTVVVVTSDRGLRARVRSTGADVGSPRALLEELDARTGA